jgi:hypothetical protein
MPFAAACSQSSDCRGALHEICLETTAQLRGLRPDLSLLFVSRDHAQTFATIIAVSSSRLPIDPGAPPLLHDPVSDATFKESAIEVCENYGDAHAISLRTVNVMLDLAGRWNAFTGWLLSGRKHC